LYLEMDLTNEQWDAIKKFVPEPEHEGTNETGVDRGEIRATCCTEFSGFCGPARLGRSSETVSALGNVPLAVPEMGERGGAWSNSGSAREGLVRARQGGSHRGIRRWLRRGGNK